MLLRFVISSLRRACGPPAPAPGGLRPFLRASRQSGRAPGFAGLSDLRFAQDACRRAAAGAAFRRSGSRVRKTRRLPLRGAGPAVRPGLKGGRLKAENNPFSQRFKKRSSASDDDGRSCEETMLYAIFSFATSTIFSKALGSLMASSERILRLTSTPASLRPLMKRL